jgi:hypothetical protein
MTSYRLEDSSLAVDWEFKPESADQQFDWKRRSKNSNYYFIADKYALFPFRKQGDYYINALDLKTGRTTWEKHLDGVEGFFYFLSNCQKFEKTIAFILSTAWSDKKDDRITKAIEKTQRYVDSKLLWMDYASGKIEKTEILPSVGSLGFKTMGIAETKNDLVYCIYGNILKIEDKSRYHGSL